MIGHPPSLRPREQGGNKRRRNSSSAQRPEQGRGETGPRMTYGSTIRTQRSGFIRVLSQNIDGLCFGTQSDKLPRLKHTCDKYGVDIITLSETNVNWKKVRSAQTLQGRTQLWKESVRTIAGHNIKDHRAPRH